MTRQRRRLPPLVAAAFLSLAGGSAALAQQAPSTGSVAETRQILAQAQTAGDRRALGNVIGGPAQTAAGPTAQQPTATATAPVAAPVAAPGGADRAAAPVPPSPGLSTAPQIDGVGTPESPRVIVRMPPLTPPVANTPSPPAPAVQVPTAAQGAPVATAPPPPRQATVPLSGPPRQFGSEPRTGSHTVFADPRAGHRVLVPHADAGWCPPARW